MYSISRNVKHASSLKSLSAISSRGVANARDNFKYLVGTYVRPDIEFTHGEGVHLYDSDGREYLDFAAGIAVNALGHSHPAWVKTVNEYSSKLVHVSNLFHTQPAAQLAKSLVEHSFADKVFFCNSGTEANEAAIKFARKWAHVNYPNHQKNKVVSFSGGFHGRTMGALSITPNPNYQDAFRPLIGNVHTADFNNTETLSQHIDSQTCAAVVEPIQGESGVTPARDEFLVALRKICDEKNVLLVFDEVQCGLGRTGRLWGHESDTIDVKPDIMTLAKPLAGGLPIGAVLVTDAVSSTIKPGDHGSTFSGGPLVCAAAQTTFDIINSDTFLSNVRANGEYLVNGLESLRAKYPDLVSQVRGRGLMMGMVLTCPVADVVTKARGNGVLVISAGPNVLRMLPPLIVEKKHIDHALEVIDNALAAQVSGDSLGSQTA
ncbi:hypothetical protein, variant 1 [Sphaeroforma arctica JP610]|uniref:acetylornithine transaminase n=1 Tax=Sphaeroforma arctica JP610 TaxID=667725 RepID=A0A0L0FW87_9EUKA|nr:hypothetical protein, variant 1 [Sphaeroforma arctica JP610]KNC80213.1 hypothetical protein, variant 1 [Sphaeroforma arctica JP610]|eukprot:XP_014154115.1 hypothetical protein, variant 1 [Sphaeroforma arctica JP610]